MICYTLVVVEALGLRIYLSWMNKKRRMKLAESGPLIPAMNTDGMIEDMTDWQSYDMVYRLWYLILRTGGDSFRQAWAFMHSVQYLPCGICLIATHVKLAVLKVEIAEITTRTSRRVMYNNNNRGSCH